MQPKSASPNRDKCGRCRTRHGGNNHLCRVHGAVSSGCCPTNCAPDEWVHVSTFDGRAGLHRRDGHPPLTGLVHAPWSGAVETYVAA